ncbi:MAG TPA: SLC13 family permease [Ottowia sp.]|uniref:SLC13 family permease n=1 Tax=Ottowia sp. TaxID=1898956 RepID=UPI002BCAB22C|nr:SLC13 family permease [Ottowia sp.]HMN22643.1 SLC13 family permease [Ottowia sp.]
MAILLFTAAAGLSIWVSNTATAAMMLPLALGIMSHLDQKQERPTFVSILLGIACSDSIGGLGTLVGSQPNGIVFGTGHMRQIEMVRAGVVLNVVCVVVLTPWGYFFLR